VQSQCVAESLNFEPSLGRLFPNTKEVHELTPISGFAQLENWVNWSIFGMGKGVTLQRLFTAFPDGWSGGALLLLRVVVGLTLVAQGVAYLDDWGSLMFKIVAPERSALRVEFALLRDC
jgi:hypothetical protein